MFTNSVCNPFENNDTFYRKGYEISKMVMEKKGPFLLFFFLDVVKYYK